jgi:cell division protein FtsW
MSWLGRTERSLLARWWWTVDHQMLAGVGLLALSGLVFVFASSPPVATRIGLPSLYFAGKHLVYLVPAALLLLGSSLLAPRGVWRLAVGLLALSILMLLLTPLLGAEIKGARRWLEIGGMALQPSEFAKPALMVVVAGLLSRAPGIRNALPAIGIAAVVALLLLVQPDVKMALMVAVLVGAQLFVAGLPWLLVGVLAGLCGFALWQAYLWFPHVAERIDAFLNPAESERYQVGLALDAIRGAAWFGKGPGEGQVKYALPDAHSDFVFAVIAEEFGLIACLVLLGLIAFVLLRGLARAQLVQDRLTLLAATGLLVQFGLQAFVNMAVNINLLPATGMTLPFISYGGSSLCALALGMGMLLALTRRRSGAEGLP